MPKTELLYASLNKCYKNGCDCLGSTGIVVVYKGQEIGSLLASLVLNDPNACPWLCNDYKHGGYIVHEGLSSTEEQPVSVDVLEAWVAHGSNHLSPVYEHDTM
jgi:hypothetical protein